MRLQILLFDGFDELDTLAPFEVLRTAAALDADLQVELVTLDGAEEVTARHGLRVRPQARLVERWCGAPLAARVEAMMEYQRRGTVWRRQAAPD